MGGATPAQRDPHCCEHEREEQALVFRPRGESRAQPGERGKFAGVALMFGAKGEHHGCEHERSERDICVLVRRKGYEERRGEQEKSADEGGWGARNLRQCATSSSTAAPAKTAEINPLANDVS